LRNQLQELEKSAEAEKSKLMRETEKLQQEIQALNRKFENSQKLMTTLQGGFSRLQSSVAKLRRDQTAVTGEVKRDLGDMGSSMRSFFSTSIVGKLQVE
jgi:hypothetical protein